MNTGAVKFRCPDCAEPRDLRSSAMRPGCHRAFAPAGAEWNLPLHVPEPVKANEDEAHAQEGLATWPRLFLKKRRWVEWCDRRWLRTLLDERTCAFVEVDGGLCYCMRACRGARPPGLRGDDGCFVARSAPAHDPGCLTPMLQ